MAVLKRVLTFGILLALSASGLCQSQAPAPLTVVLLVDKGSTAPHYISLLRQAVTQITGSMSSADRMMLCEFQESAQCLTGFSADSREILAALETIHGKAASSANFADSLDLALAHLETAASGGKPAIVVLSNAGERFQPSQHTQAELLGRAKKSGVQIYAAEIVTIFGSRTYHSSDSAFHRKEQLCNETGGAIYSFGIPELDSGNQLTDEEHSRMEKILDQEFSKIATVLNQIRRNAAPGPGNDAPEEAAADDAASPSTLVSSAIQTADMWKIIGWLPDDTETLMVARGSFTLPDFSKEDNEEDDSTSLRDQTPVKDIAAYFEMQTLLVLATMPDTLKESLSSQGVALAVRGFRRPQDSKDGEGLMRAEGCLVLVLEKELTEPDTPSGPVGLNATVQQEMIAGHSVLVAQDDEDTVLIAHPRPDVVIFATDRDYLKEVLARMGGRSGRRALPAGLAEWGHVDTNARFWAVRHYARTQVDEDPSSPFNTNENPDQQDNQAIGVTFSLDPGNPALLTYLTGGKEFMAKLKHSQDDFEPEFKDVGMTYREVEPGVLQISFPLTDDNSVLWFAMKIGWLMGQGIEGL